MNALRALLNPGYEPGDGTMDGAQLIDGQWWHPVFGCDSLQYVVDNARQALGPEVAIPAEQWTDIEGPVLWWMLPVNEGQVPHLSYLPPSWRASQHFAFTRLPPAPVAPTCTTNEAP
ncbi:MAG: hypothetical protein LW834_06730 [Cyanobium sp. 49614_E6]|jgi:hypothetical protein|nr:hypothetical protein [Cyanobium sp. 49614_E6]